MNVKWNTNRIWTAVREYISYDDNCLKIREPIFQLLYKIKLNVAHDNVVFYKIKCINLKVWMYVYFKIWINIFLIYIELFIVKCLVMFRILPKCCHQRRIQLYHIPIKFLQNIKIVWYCNNLNHEIFSIELMINPTGYFVESLTFTKSAITPIIYELQLNIQRKSLIFT